MKVKSLAVLSMAAVGFLVGCNKDNSADKKFVEDINKVVQSEKDKITTTADAVNILSDAGYNVENKLSNEKLKLAFDIDSKCFIAMENDNLKYGPNGYKLNSNTYHLYQVTDYYNGNSKYSQYLTSSFEGRDDLLVTTGLDMGKNKNIKNIQYYSPSDTSRDIYFNVTCDYLEVYAPNDVIKHYGDTNNIYIYSGSDNLNFYEYGSISYIKTAAGVFNFEYGATADIFEIVEGCDVTVRQNENAHITGAINAKTVATDAEIRYKEASDESELETVLNDKTINFIRLTGDIDKTYSLDKGFKINRSLFLDLNGRSVKFSKGSPSDPIDGETYYYGFLLENSETNPYINCFILDSQSRVYPRSGITLEDCSFIVHGTVEGKDTKTTNVILNFDSGKINVVKKVQNKSAGFMVIGNTDVTNLKPGDYRNPKNASLGMYGGYIKTKRLQGSDPDKVSFKCIQPRGDGAYVYMRYGDIESEDFCISTQGIAYKTGSNINYDKYGGVNIEIEGGNLIGGTEAVEGDYPYTPIFLNVKGSTKITDVNVTGPTCIDIKRGNLTIEGGTFNTTNYSKDITKGTDSGSVSDGSVILVEANNYYCDSKTVINIKDVVMNSKLRYITNIVPFYDSTQLPTKPSISINHESGAYTYHIDGSEGHKGTGVNILSDALTVATITCNADPEHGTWTLK